MTYSSFPDPGEIKRDEETLKRERDLYQEVKEQDEIDEALNNMEENRKKINWEVDGNDLTEVDPYAGDNWPEDTNVSDVNLFGTALKGVQKVGEGLDWVDKQVGVGDFNVYNARQTIIRPLSEVHVALGILGEFLIPDSTDIATFGLGYIPKRFLKAPKVWAKAVLAMRAADVPKVRAQTLALATGAGTNFGVPVLRVEGVGDAISTFKKNAQRIKDLEMPKTTRALFKNPKNTAKLNEFTANTPETYKRLEHYAASAVADMQSRIAQGRKRALLKDWEGPILGIDPKTNEYIRGDWLFKDDAGVEWLYTRTGKLPDYSKLDGADLAKELAGAYSIIKYDDVLIEIAKKSKWDKPAEKLAELRKIFNAEHDYWNKINPHIFKHMMMDYGVKGAYLEHKVQRAANWFWPHPKLGEIGADGKKIKWSDLPATERAKHLTNRQRQLHGISGTRNEHSNVRLLFNNRYKTFKDRVEEIIRPINESLPLSQKIVVNIEDPFTKMAEKGLKGTQKMTELRFRNLPGHITLSRAGDGKLLGMLGDYLDDLYSPAFEEGLKQAKFGMGVVDKFTGLGVYGKKFETTGAYRSRMLKERIQKIIDKADELEFVPDSLKEQRILDALQEDMSNFRDLHPWVRPQHWLARSIGNISQRYGDKLVDGADGLEDLDELIDAFTDPPGIGKSWMGEAVSLEAEINALKPVKTTKLTPKQKLLIKQGKAKAEDFIKGGPVSNARRTIRASREVK